MPTGKLALLMPGSAASERVRRNRSAPRRSAEALLPSTHSNAGARPHRWAAASTPDLARPRTARPGRWSRADAGRGPHQTTRARLRVRSARLPGAAVSIAGNGAASLV